ncbi:acyl-CoA reductase [Flavobacteriales bacterium 34_180_T64]|nr:acyl-CoA reductase [Flavobacteriales bacterium 34_180_T64]
MDLEQRINAFVKLGTFLSQFSSEIPQRKDDIPFNELFFEGFNHQIKLAQEHNGWFTKENVTFSFNGWCNSLSYKNLNEWTRKYRFTHSKEKNVSIIMAGNIPLVGFHDFISVLITGHHVLVKQSSNDKHLLPFLAKYLEHIEPDFKGRISFTENKIENFDAVIATGSDNTARYFEYYFKDKPSIIRKNRNSIAILKGDETENELQLLSNDIFRYYGLGCRNVSKLFIPRNYNFDGFFQGIYHWNPIMDGAKYANNYDYNKAVYLMSEFEMLENGFLMIKEDKSFASPIATVFYEYYDSIEELKLRLSNEEPNIQCVVSNGIFKNEVAFGQTQKPQLWDYADGVDTIAFLLKI